jgi:hypothetical protein
VACEHCPCPDVCLQRQDFCNMASRSPKIEREIIHICERSKMKGIVQSERTVISTGNGGMQAVPAEDAIKLNKEISECPNFNKVSNCGCGRSRCIAGKGGEIDISTNDGTSLVSFWDCAACLRPHMEIYTKNAYKRSI